MRKLIIAMMMVISSLSAGTVGANSDGKIMNKAYLDIIIGDEVNYQYVTNNGQFDMFSRKLNKVFNLYYSRGLTRYKFIISGKLTLPSDVPQKVTSSSTNGSVISGNYTVGKAYINGKRISSKNILVKPLFDAMGSKYLNLRIESDAPIRFLKGARETISGLTFKIKYQKIGKGRGAPIEEKTAIPSVYCIEE